MDWWGWIIAGLAVWTLGIAFPIAVLIGKSIKRGQR